MNADIFETAFAFFTRIDLSPHETRDSPPKPGLLSGLKSHDMNPGNKVWAVAN